MMNVTIRHVLPALTVGAILGFAVARQMPATDSGKSSQLNPREAFLSSDDDVVDYGKIARACTDAARRFQTGRPGVRVPPEGLPESDSEEVTEMKERLDALMSESLENGKWTRRAAMHARRTLAQLPSSDAEDFERLVLTAVEQGDMKVQPGAWLPR